MMENKTLYAGYSKCLLTPDFEVSLAGYGDDLRRRSEGVASDIYMTCVAVANEETTVLLLTADALSFRLSKSAEPLRRGAEEFTRGAISSP